MFSGLDSTVLVHFLPHYRLYIALTKIQADGYTLWSKVCKPPNLKTGIEIHIKAPKQKKSLIFKVAEHQQLPRKLVCVQRAKPFCSQLLCCSQHVMGRKHCALFDGDYFCFFLLLFRI